MSAIVLVIAAACIFAIAYRLYGVFIASKVLSLDEKRKTPAYAFENGYDYVPTNKWVLFGHHFAAIAGAGPLVGPVLAAQFGYLPGALWILIGATLAGAVHDMVILFASVRHEGKSLAEIARAEVGKFSGFAATIAVIFILLITVAGLAIVVVNSLFNSPWGTFTVGATIPIALFMAVYMKWIRPNKVAETTIIGVVLMIVSVVVGPMVQHSVLAPYLTFNQHQMTVLLALYGLIAAVLPVWLLLTPRDYLSTYMKIGVISLLAIGVIFVNPIIKMPAMTKFIHGGGPIIPGKVWPFVFITIACGALSGFHSLISTGTTPKMIKNEKDILPIGYGAMLVEGFVSIMALIAATSLHPGDYFAINVPPQIFAHLGMNTVDLSALSKAVGETLAGRTGGAVTLGVGMSYIFSSIPGFKELMSYLYHFSILFEALFILTTVDAGTRIGRYVLQEAGGYIYKPLKNKNWWPGIIITSIVFTSAWGYLVYNGSISTIWPLFGTSNQLLASIALAIGTTMLLKRGKAKYIAITAVPFAFMIVTTVTAAYLNIVTNYLPSGNTVLIVFSIIILLLAVAISIDCVTKWIKIYRELHSQNVAANLETSN
ncbi:carbon starvation protein A [Thermoanaerobacterium thermosaccharolyticum]|uniref:carbon starvation CstA family protein n=1 Tax=Thermoanaerobacterium thermosaccharolyticum TaxID=1517 RepID=UPI003DA97C77